MKAISLLCMWSIASSGAMAQVPEIPGRSELVMLTAPQPANGANKVMVFGGPRNDVYLGCMSCDRFHAESIFNIHGMYGSKHGAESISNPHSLFGSKHAANSVCSEYAANPPVVVDDLGGYYGHLTMSQGHHQVGWQSVRTWLATVCARQ